MNVEGKYVGNEDGFKDGMEVGAVVVGMEDGELVTFKLVVVLFFCAAGDDDESGVEVGASVPGATVPRIVGYLVGGLVAGMTGSMRVGANVWGMVVGAAVVRG
jgi:hypothetical protein